MLYATIALVSINQSSYDHHPCADALSKTLVTWCQKWDANMTELRPPEPQRLGDNAADVLELFKQRIYPYLIATEPVKPRSKKQKAAFFCTSLAKKQFK
ncbi:hypothetical protein MRX96_021539 [Rhipicephalus microplus]